MDTFNLRLYKWATTRQAAAYLHLSQRHVLRLCAAGEEKGGLYAEFNKLLGVWHVNSESLMTFKARRDGLQPESDQVPAMPLVSAPGSLVPIVPPTAKIGSPAATSARPPVGVPARPPTSATSGLARVATTPARPTSANPARPPVMGPRAMKRAQDSDRRYRALQLCLLPLWLSGCAILALVVAIAKWKGLW